VFIPNDLTFSVDEAAEAAKLPKKQLCEAILRGAGPRLRRFGRRTLITREDLVSWLNDLPEYDPGIHLTQEAKEARHG
jgi:hypothetical protein